MKSKEAPDWFGCGRTITTESWEGFKAARADYYRRVDAAKSQGAPSDPLLGHPRPGETSNLNSQNAPFYVASHLNKAESNTATRETQ